ncbi:MAG: UDP-3-O-(3-hydroxymyristoyl)glucosamine N-acyltransferase [Acidobacteriaceae bacterium]
MRLSQIAANVGGELVGQDVEIRRVSGFANADGESLVFAADAGMLAKALASAAGAVIATQAADWKPMLVAQYSKLAFARAGKLLAKAAEDKGVHRTAVVDATAMIEEDVSIGPYAVIGARSRIGKGTRIEAHVVIGRAVTMDCRCQIYPHVTVYDGTRIGKNVIVHAGAVLGSDGFGYVRDEATGEYVQFPQVGRLVIEDDVEIGANTTIDRGALEETRIGRGTKLDNVVHIAHNVRVGEDVVIAAQTGVSGSAVIEKNAVVAGQVGIADHVRIEEGVILGAQCGVPTGKVVRGTGVVFWGTPARPIKEYLRQLAVLARMARGRN